MSTLSSSLHTCDDKAHRHPKGFDLEVFLKDFGAKGASKSAKSKKKK